MTVVTIVAPASPAPSTQKKIIEKFFKDEGFEVQFAPHVFDNERYLAGSDMDRAQDLNWALTDEKTDIVIALRGGYGSPRLLDKLDYEKIKKANKPFFGFSDNTALQLALYKKCKMVTFTGFNADCAVKGVGDMLLSTFRGAIQKKRMKIENLTTLVSGQSSGVVLGGTLTMLVGLMGTPYMPKLDNVLLVVEEVHESPYRIDRMLNQLRLGGYLDNLAGVILSSCADCTPKDVADGDVLTVFKDYFAHLGVPVVTHFPYGHIPDRIVFPMGQKAVLDADNGRLIFDKYK